MPAVFQPRVVIDEFGFWLIMDGGRFGTTILHAVVIAQRLKAGVPYNRASLVYDINRYQMSFFHNNIENILAAGRKYLGS